MTLGSRPVITAGAVLTPLGEDLDDFTDALLAGRSAIDLARHPDGEETDGAEHPALPAASLTGFTLRDWAQRRLPDDPETASRLRRVAGRAAFPARTAACVAVHALRDAGLPVETEPGAGHWGERTALLVAGSNLALAHQADTVLGYRDAPGRLRASYAVTHLDVDAVGVVSELAGIRREGWALGGASASGTLALIQAARLVATDEVERVLVVGPAAELSPAETESLRRTGAMASEHFRDAPPRMCRPFDRDRQGFVRGEGAAAVVVESATAARARGAGVLADVAGYGSRLDARRGTEPDAAGQAHAMRAALDMAGLAADDVDYVNAHGTGSVLGDETEATSLTEVFGAGGAPRINSTKPLTGHCLSAAGLVEAVAVLGQLRAGACHPNPQLERPLDPELPLVGRERENRPLRTALSNSFAFAGISASIVLRRPAHDRSVPPTQRRDP